MTSEEPGPGEPAVPEEQRWPGPDLYTLRGMVELDLALERGVTVDAAHALLSDAVVHAFGSRWYEWLTDALTAEGRDPAELPALLTDDALAERVLERVRARMAADDEAPDPPGGESGWYAYAPGDPRGSRGRYRRAVARRRENARQALLTPPRRRVAGRRRHR
ncbi:hypothetical protein QOZ88_15840 [Blastococcus sp. BMG 814]|uniref:DUF222 domain-containing protein n=1 Tax=Blastococcus carthaginiensis TaxID=3050034 RepID=A0ABT9IEU4_9ACTN|nr:hypothetical protein [Blastococcus carthaginiensis]MDP5184109.1 hypothetical protein [Blastococcus carthaginiensis]